MKLKSIGQEMVVQDNRATQNPLFVVEVENKRWVNFLDDWVGAERKEDYERRDLCDSCLRGEDTQNPKLDYCEDCNNNTFDFYKLIREPDLKAGVFFTAKAAQAHIDDNHYHYEKPQVYGISAWRNPEMVKVQQHLIKQSGNKVPGYYT